MSIMTTEINKITNELRCYIELSLFDSFTGKSFSKDFLDGKGRDRVTACEETLKLLNGAEGASLMMSKDEIKSNLNDIYNLFKAGNSECRAQGVTPSSMNVEAEEGFKAALDFIEHMEG